MHPNPAQGATVDRTAALSHPIADRNATYVADTRARYGHTIHLAREDLGTDGTDADRLERYAATISESRARSASIRLALRPDRSLGRE
jgi:ATP-dependent exoDNAse (exonuclease V) alpha subunit